MTFQPGNKIDPQRWRPRGKDKSKRRFGAAARAASLANLARARMAYAARLLQQAGLDIDLRELEQGAFEVGRPAPRSSSRSAPPLSAGGRFSES